MKPIGVPNPDVEVKMNEADLLNPDIDVKMPDILHFDPNVEVKTVDIEVRMKPPGQISPSMVHFLSLLSGQVKLMKQWKLLFSLFSCLHNPQFHQIIQFIGSHSFRVNCR